MLNNGESVNELSLYTLSKSYYFEDVLNYKYDNTYYNMVREKLPETWVIKQDRIFFACIPDNIKFLPRYGWKVHVSSRSDNSINILNVVTEFCKEYGIPFKYILDYVLRDMNSSKNWPRSNSNKFITIYPKNEQQFIDIMNELYLRLKDYKGPYILTDKRFKDCDVLYYRYGAINPEIKVLSDGREFQIIKNGLGENIIDERIPYFNLPLGIKNPFEETLTEDDDETVNLKNGEYTVISALYFSSAGGVYLAKDNFNNGNKVVIKEARPHTRTTSYSEKDAVIYLKTEYSNLKDLEQGGVTPSVKEIFEEWEHTFLVEEYIEGITLSEYAPSKGITVIPFPTEKEKENSRSEILEISLNLAYAIKYIHDCGFVINDLSPNNVIIKEDLSVKIIDLEGVRHLSNLSKEVIYTPGFSHKNITSDKELGFEGDLYAFGSTLFHLLLPGTAFKELKSNFFEKILESLKVRYGFDSRILCMAK